MQTQRTGRVKTRQRRGIRPEPRDAGGPPGAGRGRKDPPQELRREPGPAPPGSQTRASRLGGRRFLLFQAPSLRCFGSVAPGHSYGW